MASATTKTSYDQVVAQAQKRWKGRQRDVAEARRNAEKGAWTKLDTPERLIQRLERLGGWLAASQGDAPPTGEDAMARALLADTQVDPATAVGEEEALAVARKTASEIRSNPETLNDRMFERILGNSRDLLSIEFFEQGLSAAASVGLVSTDGTENGTGFLVGPGVMMTNWHVLETAEMAARSDLMLDFEANRFGPRKTAQIFPLNPTALFVADPELDFALVAVAPKAVQGRELRDFGFLPLIGRTGKAVAGEYINIVQHPGGKVKQMCVRNNRILDLPGTSLNPGSPELDPFLLYEADTERGSSGSPVCNDQWEVVALHHASLPRNSRSGKGKSESSGDAEEWIANEGVRTSRIVANLREKREQLEPEHRSRLEELLTLWSTDDQPNAGTAVRAEESGRNRGGERAGHSVMPGPTIIGASGQREIEIPLRLKIVLELGEG